MDTKFYFDIFFTNGGRLGGHNCMDFGTKDGFLIVRGYDDIPYVDGMGKRYWNLKYELSEIKEFKAEIMVDDETDYQI